MVHRFSRKVEDAQGGCISLPVIGKETRGWAAPLKDALDERGGTPSKDVTRIITATVLGKLGPRPLVVHLGSDVLFEAAWRPRTFGQHVLVLDPTLDVQKLNKAVNRSVHLVNSVPREPRARQVPRRITEKARPGAIGEIIRGLLITFGDTPLGVVVSRERHTAIRKDLSDLERERTRFVDWDEPMERLCGCDLTAVLGEPPVSRPAVVERLHVIGDGQFATQDPDWGELPWQAVTLSGEKVDVERRGYRNKAWQRVHSQLKRGRLLQVLANVPGEAIVFSAEDLGLPMVAAPPEIDRVDVAILEALRELSVTFATKSNEGGSPSSFSLVAKVTDSPKSISTKALSKITSISESTMLRRLKTLETEGLVKRTGTRGGWSLVPDWPDRDVGAD